MGDLGVPRLLALSATALADTLTARVMLCDLVSMAYRVLFWNPKPGVDVWLPATRPLGESIRESILAGHNSDHLQSFRARDYIDQLRATFNGSHFDSEGRLHWTDDLDHGFVARHGDQYAEVCAFDLDDADLTRIFAIAEQFACSHYDWGN